jgi:ribosomal protein S18 acetylase RimI-like enzyme
MPIRELTKKNIDAEQLDNLFEATGWRKRGERKWKVALSRSSFVCSVWDKKQLIGFGRIVEDGTMCMFYDIVVHPKYQRKGIGKKIMKTLIKQVKDREYVSIGLFAWEKNPNAMLFYEKCGFVKTSRGMKLEKYMKKE